MAEPNFIYEWVADYVSVRPHGVARCTIMAEFHITRSTAISHLEKCVQRGLIRRSWGYVGHNRYGWVYYPVGDEIETMWRGPLGTPDYVPAAS